MKFRTKPRRLRRAVARMLAILVASVPLTLVAPEPVSLALATLHPIGVTGAWADPGMEGEPYYSANAYGDTLYHYWDGGQLVCVIVAYGAGSPNDPATGGGEGGDPGGSTSGQEVQWDPGWQDGERVWVEVYADTGQPTGRTRPMTEEERCAFDQCPPPPNITFESLCEDGLFWTVQKLNGVEKGRFPVTNDDGTQRSC